MPQPKNRHKHQCAQVVPSGKLWTIFACEILSCESTFFRIPKPATQRAQQLTIRRFQFWIVHVNCAWKNNIGLRASPCFTSRLMSNTKLFARTLPDRWAYNRRSHWRYASVFPGLKQCVMFTVSETGKPHFGFPNRHFATNIFQSHHRIISTKTSPKTNKNSTD